MISSDHEYILVYSKSDKFTLLGRTKDISKYKNPDNDPRGPWASIDLSGLADASRRPNLHFDIVDPNTGNIYPPNPNRGWSKSRDTIARTVSYTHLDVYKRQNGERDSSVTLQSGQLQIQEKLWSFWLLMERGRCV